MKTNIEERKKIANKLNGLLGFGTLNWMGDYSHENKQNCFSVFFKNKPTAEKAMKQISHLNPKILKTPNHVNTYFKYSLFILD